MRALRVLAILREFGHLIGATPLLRAVAAAGHEVVVLASTPELQRLAEGLALARLAVEPPLPRSDASAATFDGLGEALARESQHRGAEIEYDWAPVFRAFDLAIVDGTLPTMLLAAVRARLGVIVVNTQLSYARRGATPPVTMAVVHDAERAWRDASVRRAAHAAAIQRAVEHGAAHRAVSLAFLEAESAVLGIHDRILDGCASTLIHWAGFPEITLVPQGFDLPGCHTSERHHYLGSQPALFEGSQPAFPHDRRERLLYCAFGSQAGHYPPDELRRRVDILGGILRKRRDLFLVLQAPEEIGEAVASLPNLASRPFWPQARVLQRASVFMTHSGMASIAEALRYRVPMVAQHVTSDQPGNAARVGFHGVGVLLEDWTPDSVEARIEAALAIPRDLLADKARAWYPLPSVFQADVARLFPQLADLALAERRAG